MDDTPLYEELLQRLRAGEPTVLATVVESAGSSPRKAGAKMLIRQDGSSTGTIGGGSVELETIAAAHEVLREGTPRTMTFQLNEEHGHVCGGRIVVYLEPTAARPRLIIIGAGHVGRALTTVAAYAGFKVCVADQRREYADPDRLPEADEVAVTDAGEALARFGVDQGTYVVIATAGHETDFAAVRATLATPARYIGVIGSNRKREALFRTLREAGYSDADLERITIPVGIPLGGDTPAEIAVSITAQLITLRRSRAA